MVGLAVGQQQGTRGQGADGVTTLQVEKEAMALRGLVGLVDLEIEVVGDEQSGRCPVLNTIQIDALRGGQAALPELLIVDGDDLHCHQCILERRLQLGRQREHDLQEIEIGLLNRSRNEEGPLEPAEEQSVAYDVGAPAEVVRTGSQRTLEVLGGLLEQVEVDKDEVGLTPQQCVMHGLVVCHVEREVGVADTVLDLPLVLLGRIRVVADHVVEHRRVIDVELTQPVQTRMTRGDLRHGGVGEAEVSESLELLLWVTGATERIGDLDLAHGLEGRIRRHVRGSPTDFGPAVVVALLVEVDPRLGPVATVRGQGIFPGDLEGQLEGRIHEIGHGFFLFLRPHPP